MHLCIISNNRIGDNLICIQVLNKYIRKYKNNIQITLVTGILPISIYDDYPMIINRIILEKKKYNFHWIELYKKLMRFKFDEIIDFRSSLISYFLRVNKRTVFKMRKNINIYRQIQNKFETDIRKDFKIKIDRVRGIISSKNYACISPFASWPFKEWPLENYLLISQYLLNKGISKIYILGSAQESKSFESFNRLLGDKVVNRCGKQHMLNDYGLLQKARIFIGNDSAMMHMAAISKVSTIALFGPTNDKVYFPSVLGNCHLIRSSESYENLLPQKKNLIQKNLMNGISIIDVKKKIDEILDDKYF
tara:strand:+ start:1378 stop:2295 length:918 start_codon:yes stop_codon:yes gene_type:complete